LRLLRIFGMLIFWRWIELFRHLPSSIARQPTHAGGSGFLKVAMPCYWELG
jgi:hypothetical protein